MTDRRKDFRTPTDHIMTPLETQRLAFNMNMVERERERQKTPSVLGYIWNIVLGVIALIVIFSLGFHIFELVPESGQIVVAVIVLLFTWLDIFFIRGSVTLMKIMLKKPEQDNGQMTNGRTERMDHNPDRGQEKEKC